MVVFSEAELLKCIVHKVGNKSRNESLFTSERSLELTEDILDSLHKYFFKPFKKQQDFYKFTHNSGDTSRNDLFHYCDMLFHDQSKFEEISMQIARHLFEQGTHPQIKTGECCVAYFDNMVIEGEPVEAVGIFKNESKDQFLKIVDGHSQINLKPDEGINTNKLDKGCIIFNTEKDSGFRLLTIDANAYDTQYWNEKFLQVVPDATDSFYTSKTFEMVNSFANELVNEEEAPQERIQMLDRTVKYFEEKEKFDVDDFVDEVIQTDAYKEQFKDYKQKFQEDNHFEPREEESFQIDEKRVKESKKQIKSTIKLDGQIQIKLNFNNESQVDHYLERGYDNEKQMNFYKVYFREEKH
jgi:hypothetical protein